MQELCWELGIKELCSFLGVEVLRYRSEWYMPRSEIFILKNTVDLKLKDLLDKLTFYISQENSWAEKVEGKFGGMQKWVCWICERGQEELRVGWFRPWNANNQYAIFYCASTFLLFPEKQARIIFFVNKLQRSLQII